MPSEMIAERAIHDAAAKFARQIWDQYGVRLNHISFEWEATACNTIATRRTELTLTEVNIRSTSYPE